MKTDGRTRRSWLASRTPIYARAGDTFFTHSSTLLGRAIRWGETDPGEVNGTWANHAGVVVEDGWIGAAEPLAAAIVIEALWKTRRGTLVLNGTEVRVFRPVPAYTEAELARFVASAEKYVGDKYGWWKLGVQLADRFLFRGRKVFTTGLYMDARPICSYLAGKVNADAEDLVRRVTRSRIPSMPSESIAYAFGMPPQAADPDEMLDFCLEHPELWSEVH